ncbi:MAG: Lrp/AsnC family transcriptional regulator [Candidatus Diapherotrites archaeon]|uniref:Lrp/AsnC family transcriptional regulator n=1 Tax=Candidatus Iainarchaeum sp. TaxID=3101447 RepID=A0A939C7P9_9ARCH|nr:Lrp/AsnC family transcriptional regulator [Candidatus Diapherotrites archaeon]
MPGQMQLTDRVRVNILDALLKPKSVQPNIRQIKKHTGYHKATVKSSLDFLEKEGVLQGYGPKVDFRKLGYKLEVLGLSQVDSAAQKPFEKFLAMIEKDPHIYWVSSVVGSGNWNILTRHIHKDIESYHAEGQKRYRGIPGFYDLVRDTQSFFSVEPVFKNLSRTKSIIELIKAEGKIPKK